jgi:MFS family permease
LTTALGIISTSFPASPTQGNRRNYAFASTGAASPLGYTVGLVLGGIFVEGVGWRWSFGFAAAVNAVIVGSALWGLPKDVVEPGIQSGVLNRLRTEIDWVGAIIATTAISMLSYVMA